MNLIISSDIMIFCFLAIFIWIFLNLVTFSSKFLASLSKRLFLSSSFWSSSAWFFFFSFAFSLYLLQFFLFFVWDKVSYFPFWFSLIGNVNWSGSLTESTGISKRNWSVSKHWGNETWFLWLYEQFVWRTAWSKLMNLSSWSNSVGWVESLEWFELPDW